MTTPTLWEIRCRATEYDNDPRMPGDTPVRKSILVVADSYTQAHLDARIEVDAFKKKHNDATFETLVVVMEELVVARKPPPPGGNSHNAYPLEALALTRANGYRLVVRLERDGPEPEGKT